MLHDPLSLMVAVPIGAAGVSLLFVRQTVMGKKRNRLLVCGLLISMALARGSAAFDPPSQLSVRTKVLAVPGLAWGVTVLVLGASEYRRARPRSGGAA